VRIALEKKRTKSGKWKVRPLKADQGMYLRRGTKESVKRLMQVKGEERGGKNLEKVGWGHISICAGRPKKIFYRTDMSEREMT